MEYYGLLFSIDGLMDALSQEEMEQQIFNRLDTERRKKAELCKTRRKRAQSVGAGLLLQLGVQRLQREKLFCCKIEKISMELLLGELEKTVEISYGYGERGKPYFEKIPLYFNVSHSDDYVVCVFSNQEIGVDLQCVGEMADSRLDRMVRHFFSQPEVEMWDGLSVTERKHFFYQQWSRKEAYGKLSGEGILSCVGKNIDVVQVGQWIEHDDDKHTMYYLSICSET